MLGFLRVVDREKRIQEGRRPHYSTIGFGGGRRMQSLPFLFRGAVRMQAGAYCLSLRAIQATAAESRLRGQAHSPACRRSSTARRAKNVRWHANHSHLDPFPHCVRPRCVHEQTERACPLQASRKMPRSSDSRISAEDSGPWLSLLSSRLMMLLQDTALHAGTLQSGYAEGDPASASLSNFAISFSNQMVNASSISCSVPPRYR